MIQNMTFGGAQGFTKAPSSEFYVPYHVDSSQATLAGAGVMGVTPHGAKPDLGRGGPLGAHDSTVRAQFRLPDAQVSARPGRHLDRPVLIPRCSTHKP